MANHLNARCQTGTNGDGFESDRHSQKDNDREASTAEVDATEIKTITNINYDCLEHIFDRLDFESFLNLADTCKRLRIAAAAKFANDYGKHYLHLQSLLSNNGSVTISDITISVKCLKSCFQLLRCFGSKISEIDVDYSRCATKRINDLHEYMSQYCADTLTAIYLRCSNSNADITIMTNSFTKPFTNVKEAFLMNINLKDQLPNFANLFPNLRILNMVEISIDKASDEVHFPQLEELYCCHYSDNGNFTYENAYNFLRANRQLRKFHYIPKKIITFTELLNLINKNQSISNLYVGREGSTVGTVNMLELNRFVAEHSLMEEFILSGYVLTADDAIQFVRKMNSLKSFYVRLKNKPECDRLISQLTNEWNYTVEGPFAWKTYYVKLTR